MLDATTLGRLWPHAPRPLIDGVVASAPGAFAKHAINTPLRIAHPLAQFSHESGGGTITAESLTYTHAARLHAVWPPRFPTEESAIPYLNNPKGLADKVYNGRMGNRIGTDDGYNYRGRGLLQLTGRDNYAHIGELCGLDLVNNPDLAFDPAHALDVALTEFVASGCLPYCDADNVVAVSSLINVGHLVSASAIVGLDERKAWLAKWKPAVATMSALAVAPKPASAPQPAPAPQTAPAVPAPHGESLAGEIIHALFGGKT